MAVVLAGVRLSSAQVSLEEIPFDGAAAFEHLVDLCELGPRPSNSQAMEQQRELVGKHFEELGGKVELQWFRVRHPLTGGLVPMANLVVQWHPERMERILLCAHYDTRPYPDRDPARPRGSFIGANDGASGVALLMELARQMPTLEGKLGVDFVLFDGEEFVFNQRDTYFLGSTYFSRVYASRRFPFRYRCGVLLDMVADTDLSIPQEQVSMKYARPVVLQIWQVAGQLGVSEFRPVLGQAIRDDHLPLNETARIPTVDLIDFDYPHWHTERDTPEQCSSLSLAKVGWVVQEWLKQAVVE